MKPAKKITRYLVRVRRDYGRDQSGWYEKLFATHAAAKQYAARKMHEPGWRVDGWPRKVEVETFADLATSYGESAP